MNIQHADMRLTIKGDIELLLTVKGDKSIIGELVAKANEKPYTVEIEPLKKKRSLDANAYAWVLMGKLAKKLLTTPEQVYREYISDTSNYEILPIKNEALEHWKQIWSNKGVGWLCDELGESKLQGYTNVRCFYGSSVYSSAEMAHLIDLIIQDCEEQGIETMTPAEIERMKREWGRK